MFTVAKYCKPFAFASSTKYLLGQSIHNLRNNCSRKIFIGNVTLRRPQLINSAKLSNFLQRSGLAKECVRFKHVCPKSPRPVGYWMLTCSGMVFLAVVIGGVTRLTESGLSMVDWKLFGEKFPTTEKEWEHEFKKYKEFPEFKQKNSDMTLAEFKRIWYMEYFHRSWGRAIGVVFFFPAVAFWVTGYLRPEMKPRVIAMALILATQGLFGWFMVKSGLECKFKDRAEIPRVSQHRLATHLGLAFILYSLFFWSALDHLWPPGLIFCSKRKVVEASRRFRMYAHMCKGLIFLTAISGAYVAGLDAGLVYNSFPKMGDVWIPNDIMSMDPPYKNLTENPTTVQFNHRILGTTTVTLISLLWILSRYRVLPRKAYRAADSLAVMAWLQAGLGITTLLNHVPTELAASHQAGSLILLTLALKLTHELKRLPRV